MKSVILTLLFFCLSLGAQEALTLPELKAQGKGLVDSANPNKAQALLMAERAAKVDAMRNLLAQIQGILPEVKEKANEERVQGWLAGHEFKNKSVSEDEKSVQIEVVFSSVNLFKNLARAWESSQEKLRQLEEMRKKEAQAYEKLQKEMEELQKKQAQDLEEIQKREAALQAAKEAIQKKDQEMEERAKKLQELESQIQQQQEGNKEKAAPQEKEKKDAEEEAMKKTSEPEKAFAELLQSKTELEARLKKKEMESQELQENFKKLIDLLGKIHQERMKLHQQYEQEAQKNATREIDIARSQENREFAKMRLQNLQKEVEQWKEKYQMLEESYRNVVEESGFFESTRKPSQRNQAEREQILRDIYVNQQFFYHKIEGIEKSLRNLQAALIEED